MCTRSWRLYNYLFFWSFKMETSDESQNHNFCVSCKGQFCNQNNATCVTKRLENLTKFVRLVVDYINLYEEILEHDGEDGKMYVDPDCRKVYANEKEY